jgi:hypothetical protein
MTCEIQGVVLAFAERVVRRRSEDFRAMLTGSLMVSIRIGDPHHHKVCAVGWHVSFRQHDASIPCFQLNAVVCYSKPDCETKGVAEPVGRSADIGIRKHGNDGTWWH